MRYGANPIDDYNKRPYYRFADEAYQVFMNWYDALKIRASEAGHSIIVEHLINYAKKVPSLALIFYLVDCVEHSAPQNNTFLETTSIDIILKINKTRNYNYSLHYWK